MKDKPELVNSLYKPDKEMIARLKRNKEKSERVGGPITQKDWSDKLPDEEYIKHLVERFGLNW